MESYIKTKHAEIWIQDGIVHTCLARELRELTLEIARECVKERLRISNGNSCPLLFNGGNVRSVEEAAKEYLSSDEAVRFVSAGAILINSPVQRIMANTFIIVYRPVIPTRFFTDYGRAIQWLGYYKNIN